MIKIVNAKHELKYDYYLSEDGKVWSSVYNRPLSPSLDKDGYEKVSLASPNGKRHRYSVHRLMMENFRPREGMENLQVNHIDGNKQNNKLSNLEWCTCRENIRHACKHGLRHNQKGENNNANKYSEEIINQAIEMILSKKYTGAEIDRKLGFSKDYANTIRRKERWTSLTDKIEFD